MRLLREDGPLIRVGHRGAALLAPENTLARSRPPSTTASTRSSSTSSRSPTARSCSATRSPSCRTTARHSTRRSTSSAGRDVALHVDLKLTTRLDEVAAAIERHGVAERTVVSSFHLPSLRAIAAHAPQLPIGFTYPEDRYGVSKRRGMKPVIRLGTLALRRAVVARIPQMIARAGARALMLQHAVVSPAAVARAHAAGAAVWAWTVDDPDELARLDAAGVDAVITNDPRIFEGVATLAP